MDQIFQFVRRRLPLIVATLSFCLAGSAFYVVANARDNARDSFWHELDPTTRPQAQYERRTTLLAIAAITLTFAAFIPITLSYLQSSDRSRDRAGVRKQDVDRLKAVSVQTRRDIDELRKLILDQVPQGSQRDTSALVDELRHNLSTGVVEEVRQRFRAEMAAELHTENCRSIFSSDERRLVDQLAILRNRGNLNLVIGVGTTLLAAGTLILTVYNASTGISETRRLIAYFVPRISTVIFVEVFSFFFLRLYKETLAEEKYYQNELTARSSRNIALEAALQLESPDSLAKLVESLAGLNQNKTDTPKDAGTLPDVKDLGDLVESAAKVISAVAQKSATKD